jgi:dTMP kinase
VRGRFITVEGIEGVGKSTNLDFVRRYLEDRGKEVVQTREPGGTPLGEDIRQLLLGHKHDGMDEATELMLMFAARNEHLARVIRPALEAGKWILCDRFTDATYAYQGGGRGIAVAKIEWLENFVQGNLRPDLTLLLDASVQIGMERAGKRQQLDRFESQNMAFFERVREAYLNLAKMHPGRYRVVDASRPLEEVQQFLGRILDDFLNAV